MRTRTLAIALGLLALAASACRAGGDASPAPGTTAVMPAAATPGSAPTGEAGATARSSSPAPLPTAVEQATAAAGGGACTPARPAPAGDTDGSVTSGGLQRTYILHVPPSYDGTRALPLVLNFHGFGSNAREQAIYSGFPAIADEAGFITVAGNGTGDPQQWTYPGLGDVDEARFVADLLDKLEAELCIDASRVYLVGMSNGAAISTSIACALPDRIAAIAEVGATASPRTCAAGVSIPLITFRGTEDLCVPYEGGTSQCGMRLPVVAAEEAARQWARQDGCNPAPAYQRVAEDVIVTAYSECTGFAAVLLYTIEGGGHTWPGSLDIARLGRTTQTINATDIIWQFFQAHSIER
jgi:polyhydroxybutyrate depolymerase